MCLKNNCSNKIWDDCNIDSFDIVRIAVLIIRANNKLLDIFIFLIMLAIISLYNLNISVHNFLNKYEMIKVYF